MSIEDRRVRLMFLCTGNSCRSQMAEGWARHLYADILDVCSAGTEPQGVNELAIEVMGEVGIDLARHTSKGVEACEPESLDVVITVCGHANENCPVFLRSSDRTHVLHHGFDDPPALAAGAASKEEAVGHYRRVRDEIRCFVETLPGLIEELNLSTGAQRS